MFVVGADGDPLQIVFGSHDFNLPVEFVAGDESNYPFAENGELVADCGIARFPWQARIVVQESFLRKVTIACEHIVSDASGMRNWRSQFIATCLGSSAQPPRMQPLDRVAEEERARIPGAKREHLKKLLNLAPQSIAPAVTIEQPNMRYVECNVTYAGLAPLVDATCNDIGVSRATLLLFALCWFITAYDSLEFVHASTQVHNREHDDAGIDCCASCPTLLVFVDRSMSFRHAIRETQISVMQAMYEDTCTDERYADEMLTAVARRGIPALVPLGYSFIGDSRSRGGAEVPSDYSAVVRHDEWLECAGWPQQVSACFQFHDDVGLPRNERASRSADDVQLCITADTKTLSADVIHTIADKLPELLRLIAGSPESSVGDTSPVIPPQFQKRSPEHNLVRHRWVDVDGLGSLLLGYPEVSQAEVRIDDNQIVAELTVLQGVSPFDIHEFVLTQLFDNAGIAAPDVYFVAERRLAQNSNIIGDTIEWIPSESTPLLAPQSAAETVLCSALSQLESRQVSNIAETYAQAGGKLVHYPAVTESLRRRGWVGFAPRHVLSPYSLRAIARDLQRAGQAGAAAPQ